jgi:hypothetical protein
MVSQRIVWTAVPNGIGTITSANDAFKVTVFVAPRLTAAGGGTLNDFPDWQDWPATIGDPSVAFLVRLGGGSAIDATVDLAQPALRSDLWAALFSTSTLVRSFGFTRYDLRRIISFPVANVVDFLTQQYTAIADGFEDRFADAPFLLGDPPNPPGIGQIGFIQRRDELTEDGVLADLNAELDTNLAFAPGPVDPVKDYLKAKMFHTVYADKGSPRLPHSALKRTPQAMDFHEVLAGLNDYPTLLHHLGLAVDLLVPKGRTLPTSPTTVQLQVRWTPQAGPTTTEVTPLTNTLVSATVFEPQPKAGGSQDIQNGYLKLETGNYSLVEVDPDGAAIKLRGFADNIQQARLVNRTTDTPTAFSVPALRSGGFAVVNSERAQKLNLHFKNQKSNNDLVKVDSNPTLFAEDLVRGYHWDVFDSKFGKWFTLCRRDGTYHFTGASPPADVQIDGEETAVQIAVTEKANPDPADPNPNDLFLHETVARFTGDSLVAQRPGQTLSTDPAAPPENPQNDPDPDFPMKVTVVPTPGTLPPLRYGRAYRMRARAAFLGGVHVTFEKAGASAAHATPATPEVYGRFEPVPPPTLLMRAPRTEGESLEHLVIRSNVINPPPEPVLRTERWVAPPKTSELGAEQHGLLDSAGGVLHNVYDMLVARATGEFTGGTADPNAYETPFFPGAALSFPVEDGNTADLPYLPDPFSRGSSFRGLPGTGAGVAFKDGVWTAAGEDWPTAHPFKLRLIDGSGAPVFSGPGGVLTVKLGKAFVATVLMSSFLDLADLDAMGVWNWLTPAQQSALQQQAVDGKLWLLTPFRVLKMVHAVRQPLVAPGFVKPAASKAAIGNTFATIRDTIDFSRRSTLQLDVLGAWTDPVDDPSKGPPADVDYKATAAKVDIPLAGAEAKFNLFFRHEFHDTKYHKVDYTLVGKTRFAEYFVEHKDVHLPDTSTDKVLDSHGVVPQSEKVTSLDGTTTFVRGTDYTMDYPAGTIKAKAHISPPIDVAVAYIAGSITRSSDELPKIKPVTIPNSARPAAPKVQYVLPIWEWKTPRVAGKVQSQRIGNGLRVYMDRPWWSSGAEERLGVVLWPQATDPPERMKKFVTGWGFDPIYKSQPPKQTLTVNDFTLATATGTSLSIDEVSGQFVNVAGHDVGFDPSRGLWYCDIHVSMGLSYFPFIRMALARFQPHSILNAHLSRVVQADFAQLTPNRTASVVYGRNSKQVALTVSGFSYTEVDNRSGPGTVEVRVEMWDPDVGGAASPSQGDELGWVPASPTVFKLSHSGLPPSLTTWTGKITLPFAHGTKPQRLVISEFEDFTPSGGFVLTSRRRLVYSDTIRV